jgi:hypothetical protein
MATIAAAGVIAYSLLNDSEEERENKDLDMEINVCSEGNVDIDDEQRRDGFQKFCPGLKFGFFSFVRFDAKGWLVLSRGSKCSRTQRRKIT